MWGYGHMGALGYGFGLGWIFQLVIWGLIIWGIIALVRHYGNGNCCGMSGHHHKKDDAMEILKNRYAKGEITKEEFEKMKNDLQ